MKTCGECLYHQNDYLCVDQFMEVKTTFPACAHFWPRDGKVKCEECRGKGVCDAFEDEDSTGCPKWKWGME